MKFASPSSDTAVPGVSGEHWVRYVIAADQRYLLGEFKETYNQLALQ